jgi:hypothetical protein
VNLAGALRWSTSQGPDTYFEPHPQLRLEWDSTHRARHDEALYPIEYILDFLVHAQSQLVRVRCSYLQQRVHWPIVEQVVATHGLTTTEWKSQRLCLCLLFSQWRSYRLLMSCFLVIVSATSCEHLLSRLCFVGLPILLLFFRVISFIPLARCWHARPAMQAPVYVAPSQHQPSTDIHPQSWNH